MKVFKRILAVIIGFIIISFYAPYCSGDGDKKLQDMYNIHGFGDYWKWFVIWGIIIFGGMFIYSVVIESDEEKKGDKNK